MSYNEHTREMAFTSLMVSMGIGFNINRDKGVPKLKNTGSGKCPKCNEKATPCCGCLGRVCPNGHLSKKSKQFTPCPKHEVL